MESVPSEEYLLVLRKNQKTGSKVNAAIVKAIGNMHVPEFDLSAFAKSVQTSFRNHELLKSVMIKEDAPLLKLQLSYDNKYFVYATGGRVRTLEVADLQNLIHSIEGDKDKEYTSIATSDDSNRVAIACTNHSKNCNEVQIRHI